MIQDRVEQSQSQQSQQSQYISYSTKVSECYPYLGIRYVSCLLIRSHLRRADRRGSEVEDTGWMDGGDGHDERDETEARRQQRQRTDGKTDNDKTARGI